MSTENNAVLFGNTNKFYIILLINIFRRIIKYE